MKNVLIAILTIATLSNCAGDIDREEFLPDASGEHGMVLILMENGLWSSSIGENIKAQLDQDISGPFIRSEPMFDFYQLEPGTLNHMNKTSRIILKVFVDSDSSYNQTAFIEKRNVYAKGQLFLVIKDSDPNRLAQYIRNNFNPVLDLMNDFELEKYIQTFSARNHKAVNEKCEQKFGMSINLPKDSDLKVEKDDFMWVKYERSRDLLGDQTKGTTNQTYWIQEGIVFWSEPYSDSAMDPAHILMKRDTVLKYNIPGKVKGSWMSTEYDSCCAPKATLTALNGQECVIYEGNWKHGGNPGAVGGGPFVQYTVHSPNKNLALTVCGYVYAPRFDKREYIRELHAMMRSLKVAQ